MSLVFTKETFLSINGHAFRLCWPEDLKHFEFWLLVGILESVFETDSAANFNSFCIIADRLIADSSDKEMSIAFCSVRFAPLLSRHCCVRSWLIPQTKRSHNILSNESPYSQYWLSLLNSAIYCEMLSPNFLLHMFKTNLSAIGFLLRFSWFAIKVTSFNECLINWFSRCS